MNCTVEVIAGEQSLKTGACKDTEEAPPIWPNDILTFNIPTSLKEVKITVWDEDKVIGDLQMEVKELMKKSQEQDWN